MSPYTHRTLQLARTDVGSGGGPVPLRTAAPFLPAAGPSLLSPPDPPREAPLTDILGTGAPLFRCKHPGCGEPWSGGPSLYCAAHDLALNEACGASPSVPDPEHVAGGRFRCECGRTFDTAPRFRDHWLHAHT